MKKRTYLILMFIFLLFITGCKKKEEEIQLLASEVPLCNGEKVPYFTNNTQVYYLSCIENPKIKIGEKEYNFDEAILLEQISFDEVLERANVKEESEDDGSVIYRYDTFSLIQCNFEREDKTVNHDIILTVALSNIEDGYCK